MAAKNITGKVFGRLTAIERVARNKYGAALWKCLCSCGKEKIVNLNFLMTGSTKSCGCYRREVHTELNRKRFSTHGLSQHPLYPVWRGMMARCYDEQHAHYANYGGRGIKVCERWQDVRNFIEDMDNRPSPKHTMDRIDNALEYCPGNCKWVTRKEQNRNKRNLRLITCNGVTKPLCQWAEETGINEGAIRNRIGTLGWSAEKALTVQVSEDYRRRGQAAHSNRGIHGTCEEFETGA